MVEEAPTREGGRLYASTLREVQSSTKQVTRRRSEIGGLCNLYLLISTCRLPYSLFKLHQHAITLAQHCYRMAEYWKSTPFYWCKFCSTYVKDTGVERKNHEASAKHQNSIQRNLRNLQKDKSREERDAQRAKDEVARLNGIVSGKGKGGSGPKIEGLRTVTASNEAPKLNAAAQRKAHAEQLAAMGVELPEELKREVTGVGGWQTMSERVIPGEQEEGGGRSLADIMKQEGEDENKDDVKNVDGIVRGVHKRKVEDEEEREQIERRKAWGSKLKRYPGDEKNEGGDGDLDALLNGVGTKKVKREEVKEEVDDAVEGEAKGMADIPVKQEEDGDAVSPVVFKKRKGKR